MRAGARFVSCLEVQTCSFPRRKHVSNCCTSFHEEVNFFVADTLLAAALPKVKYLSSEMGYSECHCTAACHTEVIPTLQHSLLLYGFIHGENIPTTAHGLKFFLE